MHTAALKKLAIITYDNCANIASVTSRVVAVPPKSPVLIPCANVASIAFNPFAPSSFYRAVSQHLVPIFMCNE